MGFDNDGTQSPRSGGGGGSSAAGDAVGFVLAAGEADVRKKRPSLGLGLGMSE